MGQMLPGATFSEALIGIVHKAMAKRPDERYDSMDDFLNGLKEAGANALFVSRSTEISSTQSLSGSFELDAVSSHGTPSTGFTGSIISRVEPPKKSNTVMAVAALVAVAAVVGGGLALASRKRTPPPAPVAVVAAPVAPPAVVEPVVAPGAPTFTTVRVQLN